MSAFIQGIGTTTAQSVTTLPLTFSGSTTAGSLLIAIARQNGANNISSVTDSQSNTYTVVNFGETGGATSGSFAYALNTVGGTAATVTFHYSLGSVTGGVAVIGEYRGSFASTFHTMSAVNNTTGSNPVTNSITPSIGDLLIAALIGHQGFTTASLTAGICGNSATLETAGTVSPTTFAVFEDGIANSASSQTASFVYSTSGDYGAQVFAFSPPNSSSGSNSSWLTINANNALRGLRH